MKLVMKALAVLSVLALATPALACGDKTQPKSAEAKSSSEKVAKSGGAKSGSQAKPASEQKPATATN